MKKGNSMSNNNNEIILQFDRLKAEAEFDAPVPARVKFNTEESEVFDFINPLTATPSPAWQRA